MPEAAVGSREIKVKGKEQPTMVDILLRWQVGLLKVIIRQTHGRLHQWSSDILSAVGKIRVPLRLIWLAVGRLWVYIGRYRRRRSGSIGMIGLRMMRVRIGIGIGIRIKLRVLLM